MFKLTKEINESLNKHRKDELLKHKIEQINNYKVDFIIELFMTWLMVIFASFCCYINDVSSIIMIYIAFSMFIFFGYIFLKLSLFNYKKYKEEQQKLMLLFLGAENVH